MTPSQAQLAKEMGVNTTAHKLIAEIELAWDRELSTGRDYMWVDTLEHKPKEVVDIVVHHFRKLGYGFQEEDRHCYADTYPYYCMRITPIQPKEPGIVARLFIRIFGGAHA